MHIALFPALEHVNDRCDSLLLLTALYGRTFGPAVKTHGVMGPQ